MSMRMGTCPDCGKQIEVFAAHQFSDGTDLRLHKVPEHGSSQALAHIQCLPLGSGRLVGTEMHQFHGGKGLLGPNDVLALYPLIVLVETPLILAPEQP